MSDTVAHNYRTLFWRGHLVRSFKKGEMIIFQGKHRVTAYVVKTGTVKAYNLTLAATKTCLPFTLMTTPFPASWIYGKVASAITTTKPLRQKLRFMLSIAMSL